jgi:hypothetical protein
MQDPRCFYGVGQQFGYEHLDPLTELREAPLP